MKKRKVRISIPAYPHGGESEEHWGTASLNSGYGLFISDSTAKQAEEELGPTVAKAKVLEQKKETEKKKKKQPEYTYDKYGTKSGIKTDLSFKATNKTIAEKEKEQKEALRQAAMEAESRYRLAPDAAKAAGITDDILYKDGEYNWEAVAKEMAKPEYQEKLIENFKQKEQEAYDAAPWYQRYAHNLSAFLSDPILTGAQLMEGKGPMVGQMDWLDDPAKAQELASRFGLTAEDLYEMSGENDSYLNDAFKFINPGHWGTQAGVGIQDASTALDEGRYLDAVGNLGYAGLNLLDAGILAREANQIGSGTARLLNQADEIIYPKRTWRASSTIGENIDYAADLRTQALAEKVAKQGEFTTSDLDELEFYLRGNTGRKGLLMGDDMTLTEYKVPFWKRDVSANKDVVALKELQGSNVNKSEYIIPSGGLSKFLYPRKTTMLKAAPEHLTKMDGYSLRTSIPFSKEAPIYYSDFAKYLQDQMNAAITPNVSFAKEIPSKARQAENVSNFKSEIDWRNWVRDKADFDNNPDVIQNLYDIEKRTKADGTWMKNADGTAFEGTPEEFVILQSDRFKQAYPKGYDTWYSGRQVDPDYQFPRMAELYPEGRSIFGGDRGIGSHYARKSNITTAADENQIGLFKFITPKSSNSLDIDARGFGWKSIPVDSKSGIIPLWEGKPVHDFQRRLKTTYTDEFGNAQTGYKVKSDDIASHIENKGMDYANIRNVFDGTDADYVRIHNIKSGNYPKSLSGNILFDLTNPSIYKSLIPAAIATGALTYSDKFEDGGYLKYGGLFQYPHGGFHAEDLYNTAFSQNLNKYSGPVVPKKKKSLAEISLERAAENQARIAQTVDKGETVENVAQTYIGGSDLETIANQKAYNQQQTDMMKESVAQHYAASNNLDIDKARELVNKPRTTSFLGKMLGFKDDLGGFDWSSYYKQKGLGLKEIDSIRGLTDEQYDDLYGQSWYSRAFDIASNPLDAFKYSVQTGDFRNMPKNYSTYEDALAQTGESDPYGVDWNPVASTLEAAYWAYPPGWTNMYKGVRSLPSNIRKASTKIDEVLGSAINKAKSLSKSTDSKQAFAKVIRDANRNLQKGLGIKKEDDLAIRLVQHPKRSGIVNIEINANKFAKAIKNKPEYRDLNISSGQLKPNEWYRVGDMDFSIPGVLDKTPKKLSEMISKKGFNKPQFTTSGKGVSDRLSFGVRGDYPYSELGYSTDRGLNQLFLPLVGGKGVPASGLSAEVRAAIKEAAKRRGYSITSGGTGHEDYGAMRYIRDMLKGRVEPVTDASFFSARKSDYARQGESFKNLMNRIQSNPEQLKALERELKEAKDIIKFGESAKLQSGVFRDQLPTLSRLAKEIQPVVFELKKDGGLFQYPHGGFHAEDLPKAQRGVVVYDKKGNVITDNVPEYGTIYVSDPNDPRIERSRNEYIMYQKAKDYYTKYWTDRYTKSIKGHEDNIKRYEKELEKIKSRVKMKPADFAQAERDTKNTKERIEWEKESIEEAKEYLANIDYRGKYKSDHYENFPDVDINNIDFIGKQTNKYGNSTHEIDFKIPDWYSPTWGSASRLDPGYYDLIKYGVENYGLLPQKVNRSEGTWIHPAYTYPSLTVRYADPEKYDWAKPVTVPVEPEIVSNPPILPVDSTEQKSKALPKIKYKWTIVGTLPDGSPEYKKVWTTADDPAGIPLKKYGGLFNYENGGPHDTEPKGLTLGPSKPFRVGFALGDNKWEAFNPNLQFRQSEFRPTYSKELPFEKRVDAYLGFPMKKAYNAAELFAEDGDPVDNYRHSVSGMYTAQALKNRGMNTGASIVASNLAGLGHEIATAFRPENMIKDTRSWKSKLIESGEDMVNNAIGSLLSPINPKLGEAILQYMSINNMMPDGVVIPENKDGVTRDMYFKKE
jgi:hypothetical protein